MLVLNNVEWFHALFFPSGNKSLKAALTAQFGSNARIVGERPRYIPLKPSFFNMCCRLVIMTLPEQ